MSNVKILHGDYRKVIPELEADLVFTSPPYNIGSKSVRKDGQRSQGKYDAKSYGAIRDYPDNLAEDEYQRQQVDFLKWAATRMKKDGVLVYNHKPRRKGGRLIHPFEWFALVPELTLMEEVIWDRGSTHNHCNRLMWPHTERLYVFRRTDGKYRLCNTKDLDFRSDVWRLSRDKPNGHNAPFPQVLAEAVVRAWSSAGDLVVDPYCGSGTTAVASKHLGRSFVGSERLKKYWQLAQRRIHNA
jgi:DNA modification methylase